MGIHCTIIQCTLIACLPFEFAKRIDNVLVFVHEVLLGDQTVNNVPPHVTTTAEIWKHAIPEDYFMSEENYEVFSDL